MIFEQKKFEKDLKYRTKSILDNSYLYSNHVKENMKNGISGFYAYKNAPDTIINKINELSMMELHSRPDLLERYKMVLNNPDLCGYHFSNDIVTVGKIYLFFVWAFSGRMGDKKNSLDVDVCFSICIKNEKRNYHCNPEYRSQALTRRLQHWNSRKSSSCRI